MTSLGDPVVVGEGDPRLRRVAVALHRPDFFHVDNDLLTVWEGQFLKAGHGRVLLDCCEGSGAYREASQAGRLMLAAIARKDYDDRRRRQMQGQAKAKAGGRYKGRA